jgi:hypothetical protein
LVAETKPEKLRSIPDTPGGVHTLHIQDSFSGPLLEKWPLEISRFIVAQGMAGKHEHNRMNNLQHFLHMKGFEAIKFQWR